MPDITPKFNVPSSSELPGGIANSSSTESVPVVQAGTMVQPLKEDTNLGDVKVGPNTIEQGFGDDIFKVTSLGLHLGAATFASAPFSVDMQGNLIATSATISGSITATTGAIGGWTINSTSITDTSGATGMSSAVTGGDDIRFWAGDAIPGNAEFRVYESGALVASSATISGSITATSGAIGGFNIGADYIRDTANTFGLASTVTGGNDVRFWAGDTFANRGTAELRIYEDGSIVGTNATFTGALFATSGWIGSATALVYESQGINTGTTGFIRGGQTSYNTGTGYFLGYDSGAYKLSIGNTTNYITWDGTELTVAGTFNIGGTTITIDNTQDIQTYLDEIETAGGGILYLQNGTYALPGDISIPGGVTLQGVSRDGVIIDCDGFSVVRISGTNVYSTGTIAISDAQDEVVGTGTTFTSGMVGRYIYLHNAWYEIVSFTDTTHIDISPAYSGNNLSSYATAIADVNFNATIKNLTITGGAGSGMVVSYAMEPNVINLAIYSNGIGLDLDYVVFPKLDTISSIENGVNLDMNFVEGPYIDYSEFSDSTSGAGIVMVSANNGTIFNFTCNDNTSDGINATNCDKIAYISFDISGNGGQGIEFVSGCDDNQITDGQINGNTSDNIKFTATSDRNTIVAVSIKNAGGYGINIAASTCDNNQIIAPAFDNNTSGNINDDGTGTIILPNTPSFIADEDLTVGQPVGISNYVSEKVARAFRKESTATLSFTADEDLNNGNFFCPIGGDKFVFVVSATTGSNLNVTVGSIDPNTKTVTLGTSSAVTADHSTTLSVFCISKLDTDKFIVFYRESASSTIIKYRVGTVSGTTITYGTAATFATAASAFVQLSASYISTDKGVMIYKCTTQADGRAIAFTTSGTTATAGTPVTMSTSIDEDTPSLVRVIATDKFAIMAIDGANAGYVQIGTLSGTTITLGTAVQFSTAAIPQAASMDILSPTTDVIVLAWRNSSTNGLDMIAATVSGTTPTFGSILATVVTATIGNIGIYAESSTSILISASGISGGGVEKVTRSGTTLTDNGLIIQGVNSNPNKMFGLDNGYWAILSVSATAFTIMIQGMSNQYFGFAESTVSRGGSVGVVTTGKIGGLSGLSPGALYQITSTGLVFSSPTATMNSADDVFVTASSDTEVVL
jgi:hypothetical protein